MAGLLQEEDLERSAAVVLCVMWGTTNSLEVVQESSTRVGEASLLCERFRSVQSISESPTRLLLFHTGHSSVCDQICRLQHKF